jgi:hypothetical protein
MGAVYLYINKESALGLGGGVHARAVQSVYERPSRFKGWDLLTSPGP